MALTLPTLTGEDIRAAIKKTVEEDDTSTYFADDWLGPDHVLIDGELSLKSLAKNINNRIAEVMRGS